MAKKVLLAVDDRQDNLFVLEQLVASYCHGCEVIPAQSGEAGLDIAHKTPVDVAVIDVQMPGMDGIEVCRRLKSDDVTKYIPVILVTAHTTTGEFRANALEAGADDFISRPIESVEFVAKIKVMLRIKEAEDKLRREKESLESIVRERTRMLQESERKYQDLYDHAPEMFASVDARTAKIIRCNQTLADNINYNKEEIIGRPVFSLYHQDCMEDAKKSFQSFLKTGVVRNAELQLKRRNGSTIDVNLNATAMRDEKGGILYSRSVMSDISERKRNIYNLRKSLSGIVRVLASIAEIRDPYTAGHQRRVADLARAIATEMGLPEEQINGLRMAGVVHDLGKLTVPTEILSKPGKINQLEFELIKTHPKVGYEILKDIEFPWPIAQTVLQHHERLNGSGYPAGISGKEIIMEARILAVADVIEAMAFNRPYRSALGMDRALDEIIKGKGVLYDSGVVDACVSRITEKGYKFKQEDAIVYSNY